MTLIDSEQRSEATNPHLSFIVQAPAGSGKTEILTQRYLRLLSTVTAPEQIIALTFTRKAASEMRTRIVCALQQAATLQPALNPHQQSTLNFAKEALARNHHYKWDLLQQPNRLKIITIDALCQSINQAIPLLEKQIAYPKISEKPSSHYLRAAQDCLLFATKNSPYQEAIKTLLFHVDNRQDRLLNLFKALLSQRDQWLTLLFQAQTQEKATFEQALRLIEQHELACLKRSLPKDIATELSLRTRELAIIENNPNSVRYCLKNWDDFQQINQEIAIALSKTLLTGEKEFRNRFDHHVGLKKGVTTDTEYANLKKASEGLLSQLQQYPDFLTALLQVSQLPHPRYDPKQWEVLQALFLLLPLLVAHLHLLFSEHNEVDFTAISQQALSALGDLDNPTDLALYLDHVIHHLLIDEFQDTSITQFELITKLVQGWQANDGKTLFVVGDPMQSIYRFRQAEVGLFFRAKEQGIGPVRFKPLELRCNFRSTKTMVHWVNHHFAQLFPQQVEIESGAVCFHPSAHVIEDKDQSAIHALQFNNRQEEALHLIQLIQQELHDNPNQTLAILVRSRSHLSEIIQLLKQHQIPYQGTDIDLLSNLVHLRDVWSLTQALLLPGNRLSWLALLRSPYCGLSLTDLLSIAQYNKNQSIYQALLQLNKIQEISEEGRMRAKFFIRVMRQALSQRGQSGLSDWVVQTLKALQVEKILHQGQLDDLEQLWALLDRYEQENRLPDMKEFLLEFNSLYSQQAKPSRLQIMTIHKSKGLEFDTVFLPGLGAQPRPDDNPMLRWLKLPTKEHGNLLLVSPIQAADQEGCALYDYLSQLDAKKSHYETQRLLYVAVTRAKSRLYLLNSTTKSSKRSFHSLLKNQEFVGINPTEEVQETKKPRPQTRQLPLVYLQNTEQVIPVFNALPSGAPELSTPIARFIGIATHKLLQWICEHHPEILEQIPWHLALHELKKSGLDEKMQQAALLSIKNHIIQMLDNEIGSWILSQHEGEKNEYELLVEHEGNLVTRIIDRSFEESGKLWIIDFKTGKYDAIAAKKHQVQVNEYGHYLSSLSALPIHCGLYYLNNGHWLSWGYRTSLSLTASRMTD